MLYLKPVASPRFEKGALGGGALGTKPQWDSGAEIQVGYVSAKRESEVELQKFNILRRITCDLLLQMSHVTRYMCLSVSLCVLGTQMSCVKTAEPIEMLFGS